MSAPGIHEYNQGFNYTSSRKTALENKRPIIGKVSSFFHRRSMVSTESAMHYSTFNGGNSDVDIKSRRLDSILSKNEENEEDVDDAFEQLVRDYGLPSNLKSNLETLTIAQKKKLLESHRLAQHERSKSAVSMLPTDRMKILRPLSVLTKDSGMRQATKGRQQRPNSKSTFLPEQAAHMLHASNINTIDIGQLTEVHIMLKSASTSWSVEFLRIGGYGGMTSQLEQLNDIVKRTPRHAKVLQLILRCIKALMTHDVGIQKLLTEPACLRLIRDLLFPITSSNRKSLYAFDIHTRSLMLDVLCTLTTIQTSPDCNEYVHGWDLLLSLLQDNSRDRELLSKEDQKKSKIPFLMEDETGHVPKTSPRRFTSWMRELMFIMDKYIERIAFLAGALDFRFESAYRQLRVSQDQGHSKINLQRDSGSVMVDEGVVEYLITHLRLICTVITNPPTCYKKRYEAADQELVRIEFMESGFDRVARGLRSCPHPTLLHSYIHYLAPLMTPWANIKQETKETQQNDMEKEQEEVRSVGDKTPPLISGPLRGLSEPMVTEETKAFANAELRRVQRMEKSKDEVMSIKLNTIRVSDKDEFIQWREELRALDSSSDESVSVDSAYNGTSWLAKLDDDEDDDFYDNDDYDDVIEQPVGLYWMKGGR
ncbi:armadillo-type protein [Umbelopsis sp. AD052]|nr:armadillo-type protein [Umbelopsis sp. AD052]